SALRTTPPATRERVSWRGSVPRLSATSKPRGSSTTCTGRSDSEQPSASRNGSGGGPERGSRFSTLIDARARDETVLEPGGEKRRGALRGLAGVFLAFG